jgi:hypothetical protein
MKHVKLCGQNFEFHYINSAGICSNNSVLYG